MIESSFFFWEFFYRYLPLPRSDTYDFFFFRKTSLLVVSVTLHFRGNVIVSDSSTCWSPRLITQHAGPDWYAQCPVAVRSIITNALYQCTSRSRGTVFVLLSWHCVLKIIKYIMLIQVWAIIAKHASVSRASAYIAGPGRTILVNGFRLFTYCLWPWRWCPTAYSYDIRIKNRRAKTFKTQMAHFSTMLVIIIIFFFFYVCNETHCKYCACTINQFCSFALRHRVLGDVLETCTLLHTRSFPDNGKRSGEKTIKTWTS